MKYIIDIPDDIYQIILMDGIGQTCSFHRKVDLTPYTDIDIKEKAEEFGRGYDAGWDAGNKFHEAEKESIEDEVWELARRIICPSDCCEDSISAHTKEIFNKEGWEIRGIFNDLSYQEAKAKYEAWLKQRDEICVGDEIVGIYSDGEKTPPFVVLKVEGNYYYGIYSKTGEYVQGGLNYEKTGRHFPEVAQLLDKMRGAE